MAALAAVTQPPTTTTTPSPHPRLGRKDKKSHQEGQETQETPIRRKADELADGSSLRSLILFLKIRTLHQESLDLLNLIEVLE